MLCSKHLNTKKQSSFNEGINYDTGLFLITSLVAYKPFKILLKFSKNFTQSKRILLGIIYYLILQNWNSVNKIRICSRSKISTLLILFIYLLYSPRPSAIGCDTKLIFKYSSFEFRFFLSPLTNLNYLSIDCGVVDSCLSQVHLLKRKRKQSCQ